MQRKPIKYVYILTVIIIKRLCKYIPLNCKKLLLLIVILKNALHQNQLISREAKFKRTFNINYE